MAKVIGKWKAMNSFGGVHLWLYFEAVMPTGLTRESTNFDARPLLAHKQCALSVNKIVYFLFDFWIKIYIFSHEFFYATLQKCLVFFFNEKKCFGTP